MHASSSSTSGSSTPVGCAWFGRVVLAHPCVCSHTACSTRMLGVIEPVLERVVFEDVPANLAAIKRRVESLQVPACSSACVLACLRSEGGANGGGTRGAAALWAMW